MNMKVSDLISSASILLKFEAKNKKDVLRQLAEKFHEVHSEVDPKLLLSSLTHREGLGSTGLGNGIAIPHAKSEQIAKPKGFLAVSKQGIDFHALDGELTHVFFLMVYPQEPVGVHLVALASVARLLRDEFIVGLIRKSKTCGQVIKIIAEQESRRAEPVGVAC
ncbi:MAG: PTS sugar transporter subunit IIA [Candidatus Omnitrophota bacterium]